LVSYLFARLYRDRLVVAEIIPVKTKISARASCGTLDANNYGDYETRDSQHPAVARVCLAHVRDSAPTLSR
jgi:hypothetical protein